MIIEGLWASTDFINSSIWEVAICDGSCLNMALEKDADTLPLHKAFQKHCKAIPDILTHRMFAFTRLLFLALLSLELAIDKVKAQDVLAIDIFPVRPLLQSHRPCPLFSRHSREISLWSVANHSCLDRKSCYLPTTVFKSLQSVLVSISFFQETLNHGIWKWREFFWRSDLSRVGANDELIFSWICYSESLLYLRGPATIVSVQERVRMRMRYDSPYPCLVSFQKKNLSAKATWSPHVLI